MCPFSDLSADDLLVEVVPEHFKLRHWLLDGQSVGLLRHLLQQETGLVVQALHLDLQLVRLSFELLEHTVVQPNQSTEIQKLVGQYIQTRLCSFKH